MTILHVLHGRLLVAAALAAPLTASADDLVSRLVAISSSDELAAIEEIDAKLATLPSPQTDVIPARGFHSEYLTSSAAGARVMLDMHRPRTIDTIVLIPAVDTRLMKDYGFPVRYRIESSLDGVEWDQVVVREEPQPPPGGMPVVIPVGSIEARYLQIIPTELWQRADGLWLFALSEFMAFEAATNHAFFSAVEPVSSIKSSSGSYSWAPFRIVDGLTNLGLPVVKSSVSSDRGFCSEEFDAPRCDEWIQIDLGEAHDLSTVSLVPATTLDPYTRSGGFPAEYSIELSNDPDFAPESTIQQPAYLQPRMTPEIGLNLSSSQIGRWPNSTARHVRIRITELGEAPRHLIQLPKQNGKKSYVAALSEIQVIANETGSPNVALGRPVTTSFESIKTDESGWSLESLTDGHAAGGRLIQTRDWLDSLNDRADLERERTMLQNRIEQSRSSVSSLLLYGSLAVIGSLVAALASVVWRFRKSTQTRLTVLRRQIARDLHDEVGSTLASIRLSGELGAAEPGRDPETCDEFREIRDAATAASDSMRDIVWLIDAKQASSRRLVAHLRGLAHAMLRQIDYTINDDQQVVRPKVQIEVRRNAVLALKEALNNVRLHSEATSVEITLTVKPRYFSFVVADNGVGIPEKTLRQVFPETKPKATQDASTGLEGIQIPGSDSSLEIKKTKVRHGLSNLVKRAQDHGGTCKITAKPGGGTVVDWSIRM